MPQPLAFIQGHLPGGEEAGNPIGGIAGRISSAITLGLLAPGERLPTEADLAQQFGVAVATLRKALATLREQGLVETRRGRNGGTFIVRAPFPSTQEMTNHLSHTSLVALRDFADEHAAVSAACAQFAAERTPPGSTTRLAELAFRARDALTPSDRSTADSRFHIEVAVMAQSMRLLKAEQRLQHEITPLLWSEKIIRSSPREAFTEHLAITAAIEQGRPADAAHLAVAHVRRNIREVVEAKLRLERKAVRAELSTRPEAAGTDRKSSEE